MTAPEPAEASQQTAQPPRRVAARVLVVVGGAIATLGGLFSIAVVVTTAFNGSGSWGVGALLSLILGVVIGGMVASLGFRGLGVRRGWRSALLGALVGVVGFLGPWVTAAVMARL